MSATSLKHLLAKSTISLKTTTIGGDPVEFTLKVLSGEALLSARKLVLERDEGLASDVEKLSADELNRVLMSGMSMMAKVAMLVVEFPDGEEPSTSEMEQVLTLTGGIDGTLAKSVLQCIGLGQASGAERTSLDELPS